MSNRQTGIVHGVKLFFGIFMVLVYLGMAVLLAINFFDWSLSPLWNAVRWFFAIILAAYGLYRGYREINGSHTYGMRRDDDQDNDERYMTYADRLKMMEGKENDEKK